jgi:hypothetical protein
MRAAELGKTGRAGWHIPSVTGTESLAYDVRVDPALQRIDVKACPNGFRIERLNAPSPGAERLLERGSVVTPEGEYPCPSEGVDLPSLGANECVRYTVNLAKNSADPTSVRRAGHDLLASPDAWLWVPTPRPLGLRIQAHFTLAEGVVAAMPWPGAGNTPDSGVDFSIPETAFAWKATGAFTRSAVEPLAVPGGLVRLATLGDGFAPHRDEVRAWILEGARTSSLLFGRFPLRETLVIAVPGDRSGPAFGMALRGGGPAVAIFLDRHADTVTLRSDWTCTHEFLHLGVPRLPPVDAWLFEGLATYYTEVTRARAGIITPEQAYQHLLDGFERGRTNGGSLSLRDASAQMRSRRAFFRVYWAGAALAFLTDVAARRAGGPTLDTALRSFAECCAASEDDWTAERVLAQLDGSLDAPRFADQARRWLDSMEFPDVAATLSALGVSSGRHGEVVFQQAPDAAMRDAIMARAERANARPTAQTPRTTTP